MVMFGVLVVVGRARAPRRPAKRAVGRSRSRRHLEEGVNYGSNLVSCTASVQIRPLLLLLVQVHACASKLRSQKVVGGPPGHVGLAAAWCRVKLQERVVERVVELHDSGLVATAVAVIGRTEDGHHVTVVRPVVSLGRAGRGANGKWGCT